MSRAHVVAPSELSSLRDLELLVRTTVEGLRQGLHRSPFHGFSAEFSQYRHYRPGDDLKYVDWKAFARTNRLYSREFRETTNFGALFVVDLSASMGFPEGRGSKFALAVATAAVLGTLVIDQGDAAGLLALGQNNARAAFVPPRSGRHHLRVLLTALARLTPGGREPVATALARAAGILRRRGLVIVLSDFYEEETALGEIRRLSRMGHDVVVVQTVAQEELELPGRGAAEFEDVETSARVIVDPRDIRRDYQRAVHDFVAGVKRAVEREGLDYLQLVTGQPLESALRRFLIARRGGAQ